MIDSWNPNTYSAAINKVLANRSDLIVKYHLEDQRLMDEHLKSSSYQSLKPNRYFSEYLEVQEKELTPILAGTRMRVWHYTRLFDYEVEDIQQRLKPSSLDFLRHRLSLLVARDLLTHEETETIYNESPFHSQSQLRSGRVWAVTAPLSARYNGVRPLLESWGGESAYFWLANKSLAAKLRGFGSPRIVELDVSLSDYLNAFSVSETFLQAWARKEGVSVDPILIDLSISDSLDSAKVIRIHTKGDNLFDQVGKTYPAGVNDLLGDE